VLPTTEYSEFGGSQNRVPKTAVAFVGYVEFGAEPHASTVELKQQLSLRVIPHFVAICAISHSEPLTSTLVVAARCTGVAKLFCTAGYLGVGISAEWQATRCFVMLRFRFAG